MNETQRLRVIVICGDTTAFGSWGTRTGDDQRQFSSFMAPLVDLFNEVQERHECFLSQVADGFVAIFEMSEGHNCDTALKALNMAIYIKRRARKIIDGMTHPKPAGFRIRVNCGWGWKWNLSKNLARQDFDYFSPTINATHKLLRVNKFMPIICHESVKELLSQKQIKQAGLVMKKVLEVDIVPAGVNQEDMDLLWEVSGKSLSRVSKISRSRTRSKFSGPDTKRKP